MSAGAVQVSGLRVAYDRDIEILRGVDLAAQAGAVTSVIGPNGAGKSTLLKGIAGVAPVTGGTVMVGGVDVTGLAPHRLAAHGIAFVPQERTAFVGMTVRENLRMGGWSRRRDARWLASRIASVAGLFPVLSERIDERAGNLSGGQLRTLEVARGLISEPTLLMLDEPTAGLSPKVASEVYAQIASLRDTNEVTVLLVEQNVREALLLSDHVYVLAMGRNDTDGSADEIGASLDEVVRGWLTQSGSGVVGHDV